jgi:hypothetical protein
MSRSAKISVVVFATLYILLMVYPLYVWSLPNSILAIGLILLGMVLTVYPLNRKRRYSRVSLEHGVFILSVCGLIFPAIAASWTVTRHLQLIPDAIPAASPFAIISSIIGLLLGLLLQISLAHFWSQVRLNACTE